MGRPRKEVVSPSPIPPALVRLLRARGAGADDLVRRFALSPEIESLDEIAIAPSVLDELLDAAGAILGEPFLALKLPSELPLRRYGMAELAARSSPTVRALLARLARYASLIHPSIEGALDETREEARLLFRTPHHPRGVGRHIHEYGLALAMHQTRQEGDPLAVARRVWFIHPRPPDVAPLARFFGTVELEFGALENGLAFSPELLARPTRAGDPRLLATVEELAESALSAQTRDNRFAAQVAARVRALLPDSAQLPSIADALHMSPRTLRRRLDDEGTTFSDLLDEVRESLARELAGDRALGLSEIAWRLGFSDLAAFSRAFKRWTGKPPGLWRRS
jgi:AraC-like DNA-binding protein